MASGSRGDHELCDLTTSATRSSAVFATSPSAPGHLDQERHRGSSPASPRNHQHSGIWVRVAPTPFRIHVVYCMRRFSAVLGQVLGSTPGYFPSSAPGSSSCPLRVLPGVVLRDLFRVLLRVVSGVFSGFLPASSSRASPGSSLCYLWALL